MTSAATRKVPACSLLWRRTERGGGRTDECPARPLPADGSGAFTLLELMLAMAVVTLLLAVVVLNLSGWGQRRRLEQGAHRFQTVLYMAKADAANLGRKLRLDFTPDESGQPTIRLLWEPNPLGEPGRFTDYSACTWLHHLPIGLVEVVRSELTGQSAYSLTDDQLAKKKERSETPLEAVTFYPDGSCDSAVIELASTADDPRTAVLEIHGITGSISGRILTPAELEEQQAAENVGK